ncbi:MAG: hypothetical protein KC620_00650 [Myxococcales bacterium]|nr:hypothetical protein [Myxococcales bacterium]
MHALTLRLEEDLWSDAERAAAAHGLAVDALLAGALAERLAQLDPVDPAATDTPTLARELLDGLRAFGLPASDAPHLSALLATALTGPPDAASSAFDTLGALAIAADAAAALTPWSRCTVRGVLAIHRGDIEAGLLALGQGADGAQQAGDAEAERAARGARALVLVARGGRDEATKEAARARALAEEAGDAAQAAQWALLDAALRAA